MCVCVCICTYICKVMCVFLYTQTHIHTVLALWKTLIQRLCPLDSHNYSLFHPWEYVVTWLFRQVGNRLMLWSSQFLHCFLSYPHLRKQSLYNKSLLNDPNSRVPSVPCWNPDWYNHLKFKWKIHPAFFLPFLLCSLWWLIASLPPRHPDL
jgi:hypothetical protein